MLVYRTIKRGTGGITDKVRSDKHSQLDPCDSER